LFASLFCLKSPFYFSYFYFHFPHVYCAAPLFTRSKSKKFLVLNLSLVDRPSACSSNLPQLLSSD
jgi:hypothetical protein